MEKHFEILRPVKGISKKHLQHAGCMYMPVLWPVSCDEPSAFRISARKEWPNQEESSSSLMAPSLSASVLRLRVERD